MSWFTIWQRKSRSAPSRSRTTLQLERLEDRLVPASADLVAFRPVTDYINYASYPIADAQEESYTLGPGIRFNGDNNNNNLVRVDVAAAGTAALSFTANLKVWSSQTKQQSIASGSVLSPGTVWVEYVSATHTTGSTSAVLTLSASDAAGSATDKVVFHDFQSVVIGIGGNGQDPTNLSSSGIFTIGVNLYRQGYDVKLYSHDKVNSNGTGAAYNDVVTAVTKRNVDYLAIIGFSWGGGAEYQLAAGLKANTALQGQYTLSYTAYIDGITHYSISSERRLPPGTLYHDNIYQRKDWLLKGNSVTGANNLNVTLTTWGKNLVHTSMDDDPTVQGIIITNLTAKVIR
jgi:hypothetical protein